MSGTWRPARGQGRDAEPRPVGASLPGAVAHLRGPEVRTLRAVFGGWEEVVGREVARHARPVALRGTRLVVAVDQPAWAAQLRWLEADLVARLTDAAGPGAVTGIDLQVRAEWGGPAPRKGRR